MIMDKKQIISTLLTPVLLLLASCRQNEEQVLTFDTFTIDKTVALSDEERSPQCSMSLTLAYATEANGHRAEVLNNYVIKRLFDKQDISMQTAAEEFIKQYTTNYKSDMLPLYNQDRADTTRRAWFEYHFIITTETRPGSKGTTAYLATVDYYEGGAHGINQLLTMNFETETGQKLELKDIFTDGYEKQLTTILCNALQQKTGAKSLAELKNKGYLLSMEMFPSENFILDEETITFVYNPYEIAPYAMGTTELTIPYNDIQHLLKNSFNY